MFLHRIITNVDCNMNNKSNKSELNSEIYLSPVVWQMQQCLPVYYLAPDLWDIRWIPVAKWLSKQLVVMLCWCMSVQCHPNKSVRLIRIVLSPRACENRSIDHQWIPYTLVLDDAMLNRAKFRHPPACGTHVLSKRPTQGQHGYRCDRSAVQPQTNPTKIMREKKEEKQNVDLLFCRYISALFFVVFFFGNNSNLITFPGLVPIVSNINPLGSFVRNLNDIELCLPVSHGGSIWMK